MNENKIKKEFLKACEQDDVLKLKILLKTGADPTFDNDHLICFAAEYNKIKTLKVLLQDPRVNPTIIDNFPIKIAFFYGYKEIVKILFQDKRVRDSLKHEDIEKIKNLLKGE